MLRSVLLVTGLLLICVESADATNAATRQLVAGTQVAEAARQYLLRQLEPVYPGVEVTTHSVPGDVTVANGALELDVRELTGQALRSRMVLWVDVRGGGASRPVPVPLTVRAMRPVLLARRALTAGAQATADDFEVALRDVAAMPAPPARLLTAGVLVRLRKGLDAGQVLLQAEQMSAAAVLRGDRVRLLAGRAGVAVESPALALSDGEPGQWVAVRPVQGDATVQAMVAGAGLVRLEK